jgi:hypothetical protein
VSVVERAWIGSQGEDDICIAARWGRAQDHVEVVCGCIIPGKLSTKETLSYSRSNVTLLHGQFDNII